MDSKQLLAYMLYHLGGVYQLFCMNGSLKSLDYNDVVNYIHLIYSQNH